MTRSNKTKVAVRPLSAKRASTSFNDMELWCLIIVGALLLLYP